jgi:hypothetical protein
MAQRIQKPSLHLIGSSANDVFSNAANSIQSPPMRSVGSRQPNSGELCLVLSSAYQTTACTAQVLQKDG